MLVLIVLKELFVVLPLYIARRYEIETYVCKIYLRTTWRFAVVAYYMFILPTTRYTIQQ